MLIILTNGNKPIDTLQVKVLGAIGLIDGGETDWKLISIDIKDAEANKINSLEDIEQHKPGLLNATVKWFRDYKIPEGKPKNRFYLDGKALDSEFAKRTINKVHNNWIDLMESKNTRHSIDRSCTRCGYSSQISPDDVEDEVDQESEKNFRNKIPISANNVDYCK